MSNMDVNKVISDLQEMGVTGTESERVLSAGMLLILSALKSIQE